MLYEKLLPVAKGAPSDPYFYDVSLLLTGDGTNGAQNNTFLDSSTNNFTITRNGNTTQGTFSPYGNLWSNYFDGSGDSLTCSGTALQFGTGDFSIECWLYPTVSSGVNSFIAVTPVNTNGFTISVHYPSSGSFTFYSNAGTIVTAAGVISTHSWNHVAITRSGTTLRLFVNGVIVNSVTNSTNFSASTLSYIGDNGWGEHFNGYISNLRVVKGTALYTSNFTPSTTPLTAVSGTSLLTCQSNRFIDNSANNFTLTVNGNTSVQRFSPFNPTAPYSASTIGGSGYFDGSGDYLSVSTASASGDLTMEFWVYPTVSFSSGNYGLFAASDQRFGMITVSGNLYFLAGSDINTSTPLKVGMWSHVAISKNSGTIRIFLNGVQIGSAANSDTATGNWRIASDQSGEIFPACYMSDVRYIAGTGLYTTAFTPPTAPLTSTGSQTKLLCNFTNAGIHDAAMMNDLETVGNAQVSTSVKKYGTGSLAFDGTGDYLLLPRTPQMTFGSGDFTIEAWVYTASSSYGAIFSTRGTVNTYDGISLQVRATGSSAVQLLMTNTGPSVWQILTQGGAVSSNTWTHIALVRNGTSVVVYINGTAAITQSFSGSVYQNTTNVAVGTDPDGAMNGYLDDLRITKGYARYTANFTPPTAALPTY